MNEYIVEFSYMSEGQRIYEYDYHLSTRAEDAAEETRHYCGGLDGFRVERVWIDTGRAWETRF